MKKSIIIGTRGSQLALWQAHFLQAQLADIGCPSELKIIKTKGDRIQDLSFNKIEGKGFFTKEIEEQLLNGSIDLAVHSYKDLPTEMPKGLKLAGNSYREDPRDLLLINTNAVDKTLPLQLKKGAVVGTSSARRKSQLLALRSDLKMQDIRGNVPTRLKKVPTQVEAVVLAAAGIQRLEIDVREYTVVALNPQQCVPAPAQGVLAFQIRENDEKIQAVINQIKDSKVEEIITIERSILQLLGGGCQQPIGVYCEKKEDAVFQVWASHAQAWNEEPITVFVESETKEGLAEKVVALLQSDAKKKSLSRVI